MKLNGIFNFDSTLKNKEWGSLYITRLMLGAEFLIDHDDYDNAKAYAHGHYFTEEYKKSYYSQAELDDPLISKISFEPIDLFSVYGHVIKSAIDKQPIIVKAKCKDKLAKSKLEDDIAKKVVYKQQIEPFLKLSTKALGGNPNNVKEQDDSYDSNMGQADALNLDLSNSLDKAIFENVLQRGKWETSLAVGIDHFVSTSELSELRKKWEDDFLYANAIAGMVYINSGNGLPECIYIKPDNAFSIGATRKDKRDAEGVGYVRRVTVRQFLKECYDEIKGWDEIDEILAAANISSGTNYSGVWNGAGEMSESDITAGICSFDVFCSLKITLGYIEFKSQNVDKYESVDRYGNDIVKKKNADYAPPPNKKVKGVENRYYEVTYRAYFLHEAPNLIYGFGLLPRQLRYGAQNELSDYSIQLYQEEGQSLVQRSIPFIKMFFELWLKFQYYISEAKASGIAWNYNAVNKVAQKLKSPSGQSTTPEAFIRFLRSSVDALYLPELDDEGKPLGGDATPFKEIKRGLDPAVTELLSMMAAQVQHIRQLTGINEVQLGSNPQPDAGYRVSALQLKRSQEATYYIDSGLAQLMTNQAKVLSCNIQNIIYDKSFGYEALVRAIGDEHVANIKSLGLNEPSAYNIFISIGMNDIEKAKLDSQIDQMMAAKMISFKDGFLIQSLDDYTQAQSLLVYFDEKSKQDASKNAQAQFAMEQQKEAAAQAGKEKIETIRGTFLVEVAKINKGMDISKSVVEGKTKLELQDKKMMGKLHEKNQSFAQQMAHKAADQEHEMDVMNQENTNAEQSLVE